MNKFLNYFLFFFIFNFYFIYSQDLVEIPALKRPVTDTVGILKQNEIQLLEEKILSLQKDKGYQIAVLIIPSTQPESIEQYSIRVVEQWKLGRKGIDDGVLILIAFNDKKIRLEIGYGLEGIIPDAKAKQIIEDIIKPYFKKKDYFNGIYSGIDAITKLINDSNLPENQNKKTERETQLGILFLIYIFIFFINLIFNNKKKFILFLDIILLIIMFIFFPFWDVFTLLIIFFIFYIIILLLKKILNFISSPSRNSISSDNSFSSYTNNYSTNDYSDTYSGEGGSFGGGGASGSWSDGGDSDGGGDGGDGGNGGD